jgi:hypothetical protein
MLAAKVENPGNAQLRRFQTLSPLFNFNIDRTAVFYDVNMDFARACRFKVQINHAVADLDAPEVQFIHKTRKRRANYAQALVESVSREPKKIADHKWD